MILAGIPSPTVSTLSIGPLTIHFYALCILAGIAAAYLWASRRWQSRGGSADDLFDIVFAAVIAGIIGARIWHVLTSPAPYFGEDGDLWAILRIWEGGLAIYGAVAGGGLAVWIMSRVRGASFAVLADVIAPTLLLAQAIGRLGNWFNQELYGGPSDLPWAVEISCRQNGGVIPGCTPGTYEPTFLYEILWNLAGCAVLVLLSRRFRLGGGRTFWLYAAIYSTGRALIDSLRTEPVMMIGALRIHTVIALVVLVISVLMLVLLTRRRAHRGGEAVAADGSWELGSRARRHRSTDPVS
ncbi:prolipoprotein diacylglyceryl transferase [Brachybacterium sp. JHP9]|uniref:Phosphatidylglycerol--prolipoprotein diacylglyceryl transferase n=1 Tax=Brachybacterium equifaecis TaxID=2910770 RepID=A0ABT0R0H4_9MICO|nr:prolipoprotein diacylglyceryl transferase [Brachybacterium equifaecis]MCL6423402.1 prolipoprotein diacylglyceryl transferase [Brachybacterium equifaecis]